MEPKRAEQAVHYHIRWKSGTLDWEPHVTRAEAEEAAICLATRNETYIIEATLDESCQHCRRLLNQKGAD